MKTLNTELLARSLEVTWSAADECSSWNAVTYEIEGMLTLSLYMEMDKEIREEMMFLWKIALWHSSSLNLNLDKAS